MVTINGVETVPVRVLVKYKPFNPPSLRWRVLVQLSNGGFHSPILYTGTFQHDFPHQSEAVKLGRDLAKQIGVPFRNWKPRKKR